MNFTSCLTWVARGVAEKNPHKLQLSPEELKKLIKESKDSCRADDDEDNTDSEAESEHKLEPSSNQDKSKDENNVHEEYNIDKEYDLENYDDDESENKPFINISDIAVHVDNKDDEYIEDSECEDEIEEKEDFTLQDKDNLLVVGHVEDESSVLEVYVYNEEQNAFFVHHDIVLPAYPLHLEWLDFHPSDDKPGNYVALGDMTPVIKIWDLDVVDILEPETELGSDEKDENKDFHKDAVLSLSWNKHVRNILASGSADTCIILWDLTETKMIKRLQFHSNKVQSLEWHPHESPFLLSGCTDGFLKIYDCRDSETAIKSWKVEGEIEKVKWNLFDSFKFFCSTDKGNICSFDMRNNKKEYSLQAHSSEVTGLDMSPLHADILITASMDKSLKAWNIKNEPKLVKSWEIKVGSIYAAKAAPDLNLTVAVGGNNSSNNIIVKDIAKELQEMCDNSSAEVLEEKESNARKKRKHFIFQDN